MTRFRFDAVATYVIAVLAFALSYANLADLAARAGYGTVMAHARPLVVDGPAVVAGAAAHLLPTGPLPGWAGAAVAVVPPLCLLVAPHLAVQLRRDAGGATRTPSVEAAVETAPPATVPTVSSHATVSSDQT